jgi:CubicO group peptidase (beta-lactamase class C family)
MRLMVSFMFAALTGLWGAQNHYGAVSATLAIDESTRPWTARIHDSVVPIERNSDRITFSLASGGDFRGRVLTDGDLEGFWIQPPVVFYDQPYASPVRFGRSGNGVWQGAIAGLDEMLTLYLVVTQAPDGSLHAFIRNPEANIGAGRPFVVHQDGTRIVLQDVDDASDRIDGTIDPSGGHLTLDVKPFGSFAFTRRTREDAVQFYPSTPPLAHYTYAAPTPYEDGWRVSTLQSERISSAPIEALVDTILASPVDSVRAPYVQALAIARHGKLVLEDYFYGWDRERPHDMRSASKSFTGLLAGIAIERGAPLSLQSPIESLLPNEAPFAYDDTRKRQITFGDLLSMQSGLACDDNDDSSPGNEDRMYSQTAQPDYYKFALDLPMVAAPGSGTAVYCTSGMNLAGGAIRAAITNHDLLQFFDDNVAQPLQIAHYDVNLAPNGDAYMGGGMYLRPRDALKLGQLYLDNGVWNGRKVVATSWIRLSTSQQSAFPASAYAASHGYGLAWHLFTPVAGGKVYREYMAQGNGGQLICVLPDLDAVVLFMSANYNNFPVWRRFFDRWIPQYVIPAMLSP